MAVDYLGFGLSERPERYGYTIEEHARTVGELVDDLELDAFVVMGQECGGPIGSPLLDRLSREVPAKLGPTPAIA